MDWKGQGPNCTLGYVLPWRWLGQCTLTSEQLLGFIIGLIGIFLWMMAHVIMFTQRQRVYHYQTRPTGVACVSLIYSTLSHAFDCSGCIMAGQLPYQLLFGVYMLATDVVYVLQHLVMVWLIPRLNKTQIKLSHPRLQTLVVTLPWFVTVVYMTQWFPLVNEPSGEMDRTGRASGRVLLAYRAEDSEMMDISVAIGYVCGMVAMVMYWTGHIPVLIRVLHERSFSPQQLSYQTLSVLGNTAYIIAVLTQGADFRVLVYTLPWTLGRLGLIGFDLGILLQVWLNNRRRNRGKDLDEDVVSLLKSEEDDTESTAGSHPGDGSSSGQLIRLTDNDALWIPLQPINNRYLRQIHRLSKYMAYQTSGEWYTTDSSESEEINMEERSRPYFPPRRIRPERISDSSDVTSESENNLTEDWLHQLSHSPVLNEEEVFEILASEDQNNTSGIKVKVTNEDKDMPRARPDVPEFQRVHTEDEVYWFSEKGLPEDVAVSVSELSIQTDEGHTEVMTSSDIEVTMSRSPSVDR